MTHEEITKIAETWFEWPDDRRECVTYTSAMLFARAMYEQGQAVEREKYADLIAGAKAVGLQPCVVGTRTVWQKKRGK